MRNPRTYIGLSLFIGVALLAGLMELGTLTGPHVGRTTSYTAVFGGSDGVSGLRPGNPVRVSGVPVGKVTSIRLVNASRSEVRFTVNSNQQVTSTTWAIVRYANLLGQRYLALTQSGGTGSPVPRGSTIPPERTAPALSLTALFNGFRPLFSALTPAQVNDLSGEIVAVLQGQTDVLDDLIGKTASLTTNLANRDAVFSEVVDSLSTLLSSVRKNDDGLARMVTSLGTFAGKLKDDGPALLRSLDSVDRLVGGVGHLLQNLEDHNLPGDIADLNRITGVLATNNASVDKFLRGFSSAFGTFNRLTQNGSFANAYPCNISIITYGDVSMSGADGLATLEQLLGRGGSVGGSLGTILSNLTGGSVALTQLATAASLTTPLKLPNGKVGDTNAHTKVCQ